MTEAGVRTTSIAGSRGTRVMKRRAKPAGVAGRAVSMRTSRAGTAMTVVPDATSVAAAAAACIHVRAVVRGASASGR